MRENLAGDYYLVSDITFPAPGEDGFPAEGFEPVGYDIDKTQNGFQGTPFTGRFDGNGHTIHNLFIQRPDEMYVGLFGQIKNASVLNVRLEGIDIHGNQSVGGIAGESIGGTLTGAVIGTTQNHIVRNTGQLDPGTEVGRYTGGLVGLSSGTVTGYVKDLSVESDHTYVGGLVGVAMAAGKITGYSLNLNISGYAIVGGLLGGTSRSYRTEAPFPIVVGYATGSITGNLSAGGLVGSMGANGRVVGYYKGSITGRGWIGGLVSQNHSDHAVTRGYMRGRLVNNGSPDDYVYAFLVGGRACRFSKRVLSKAPYLCSSDNVKGDIAGYRSGKTGESEVSGIPRGKIEGNQGTEITVSASTTQADFSHLDFGSEPGQWTFHAGKWPSINLGPDPLFANTRQPIEP